MSIVSLKCPTCDASLTMDDSREFGFCEYCGTKIAIPKENISIFNNYNMGPNEHIVPDYKRGQYTGETVNGLPNGRGFYMWPDGVRYEGQFVNGVIEGFGKKTYGNSYYEGEFHSNLRCGHGKYVDELGSVFEGTFKNDMKNGKFHSHIHYADKTESDEDATYVDDRQEGPAIFRFSDGMRMVVEMHNGTYNGEQFVFDPRVKPNMAQKQTDDFNDMINDFFNNVQSKGKKTSFTIKTFSNVGTTFFDSNMQEKAYATKGHVVNGVMNGTCKSYYPDGSWDFGEKVRGTWSGQVYHCDSSGKMSVRTYDNFGKYTTVRDNVTEPVNCSFKFSVIGEAVRSIMNECSIGKTSFNVKFILPTECADRGAKLVNFQLNDGMNTHTVDPGAAVSCVYGKGMNSVHLTQVVKKGLFGTMVMKTFDYDVNIDSDAVYRFSVSNGRYSLDRESVGTNGMAACFSDD